MAGSDGRLTEGLGGDHSGRMALLTFPWAAFMIVRGVVGRGRRG